MEGKILTELKFNICLTTSLNFFERYSHLIGIEEKSYWLGRYLLELCLTDGRFSKFPYSILASAAIYLSQKIYKKYLFSRINFFNKDKDVGKKYWSSIAITVSNR